MRVVFLGILGFSFGVLSAAGVFTVLVAVSLVPRFVGKTHTGKEIRQYENWIVLGTIIGNLYSLCDSRLQLYLVRFTANPIWTITMAGALVVASLFCGMFVGCLALAIAEMLDSFPIFTRRIRLSKGTGILILSVAVGKLAGSFFYFWLEKVGW